MKTKSINVYKYEELSKEAQATARDWFREDGAGDDWYAQQIFEYVEEIAPLLGLTLKRDRHHKPAIYFSGFWSQGDGACFEGTWSASDVQAGKLKDYAPQDKKLHCIAAEFERIAKAYPDATFSVKHSGHYSHKMCTDFDVAINDGEEDVTPEYQQAETDLIEAARDFMDWIYQQLEISYNYSVSDEVVAENIRANEYDFTEDGKRSVIL